MLSNNQPFGLINLGNTCYMNTILQTLFICCDFNEEVLMAQNKLKKGTMVNSYKTILRRMIDRSKRGSKGKLKLTNFIQTFRNNFQHVSFNQQDAHEAMFFLLSKLHENLKEEFTSQIFIDTIRDMRYNKKIKNECARQIRKMYNKDYSMINEYFYGQWCSVVKCSKCNHEVNRVEVFKGFNLEIKNTNNLNEAIKEYMTPENLEDYKCDNCQERNNCSKKYVLLNTPKYLFVQLKRFNFDWNTNRFSKENKKVEFPDYLHFKDYLLQNNENKNVENIDLYKLKSIINHQGAVQGGHYYSYHNFKDKWVKCDDEDVSFIDEDKTHTTSAYILLYEKVKVNN